MAYRKLTLIERTPCTQASSNNIPSNGPGGYSKHFVVYNGMQYRDIALTYKQQFDSAMLVKYQDTLRSYQVSPVMAFDSRLRSDLVYGYGINRDPVTIHSPFDVTDHPTECPLDSSSTFCPAGVDSAVRASWKAAARQLSR
jgi:hypothetical protein